MGVVDQSRRDYWRERMTRAIAAYEAATPSYQPRVGLWMDACFGPDISADITERNHRFIEEALELVQANGCTTSEAHSLVDYVYGRDQGEINQEVGGVMVTLAALCNVAGVDMLAAGETELARVWTKIDQIRAKQAAKPKHSPLPAATRAPIGEDVTEIAATALCVDAAGGPEFMAGKYSGVYIASNRHRFMNGARAVLSAVAPLIRAAERERIAQMLRDEADVTSCKEDAVCIRSDADFVAANGSWDGVDRAVGDSVS